MTFIFYLLVAYGLTFGLQNRAAWLRGIHPFIDSQLPCTYCVGFHTGWMVWILWKIQVVFATPAALREITVIEALSFCLASSGFSYFFDTLIRLMESYADPVEVEEESEETELEVQDVND